VEGIVAGKEKLGQKTEMWGIKNQAVQQGETLEQFTWEEKKTPRIHS